MNFVESVEFGDLFLDPFHFVNSVIGKTNAIARVTEVGELKERFGKPDRIVKYEKFVPKNGEYGVLKFIENSSIWAGSLKSKIPNDVVDIIFEKD